MTKATFLTLKDEGDVPGSCGVIFRSGSADQTRELGRLVSEYVTWGGIIGLSGPLGAGKTEFMRGVAEGYDIGDVITSPTYVLEAIYTLPKLSGLKNRERQLHHWDLYRLTGEFPLEDLSEFHNNPGHLTFVEWPERAPALQKLLAATIRFEAPSPKMILSETTNTGEPTFVVSTSPGQDMERRDIRFLNVVDPNLKYLLGKFQRSG